MYLNKDEIIRMAQDSGLKFREHLDEFFSPLCDGVYSEDLEDFAALVAAAEREKMKWDGIHTCHADCQNPACIAVREAVKAEREACAKVCESLNEDFDSLYVEACIDAIRERGQ